MFASDRLRSALANLDCSSRPGVSKVVVFTSINWAYLTKAMVLAESLKQHNPDFEFHLLINDYVDPTMALKRGSIVPISLLGIDGFHAWCFSHDVVELCTATKAFYFYQLLDAGYDKVIYLDPDIRVFSSLDPVTSKLDEFDVVLIPHCDVEASRDCEIHYTEMSVLAHGVFNLGFLGIANTCIGSRVINFWRRRMERHCRDEHERGLFTDQKWFNLVPVYFDNVCILKHPGVNVASWNISSRPLSTRDGK